MAVALDGNNPGGIRDGAFAHSQHGYAGHYGDPEHGYAAFHTLADGVNAMRVLLTSYIRRGFNTPQKIADRWAPKADGNDNVAYARKIADGLHIGVHTIIPADHAMALTLVQARIENAAFPARWAKEMAKHEG